MLATDGLNVVETGEVKRMLAAGSAGPAEGSPTRLLDAVRAQLRDLTRQRHGDRRARDGARWRGATARREATARASRGDR